MNFRYLRLLFSSFLVKFKGLLLLGIAVGIFLFLVSTFITKFYLPKSVEKIGLTGKYRVDKLPPQILSQIGEGLTKIGPDRSVQPGLALNWEAKDGGKTWVFHLNREILWQDGKKLKSSDISYEFSDLKVERPDDSTIIFKLQSQFSPLPSIVSRPVFKKGLLGTGVWRAIKVSVKGGYVEELTLENEERDQKIYKFYPTEEGAKLGYKLGEVDILDNIFDPSPFPSWKNAKVTKVNDTDKFVAVFFNTQDKFLSEKILRQALSYSIHKEDLGGLRAISSISPKSWAYNPQVKTYDYDPVRAKELFSDLPKESSKDLSVKLSTTPLLLPQAEKIVKDWNEIGIKASVQVVSAIPTEYQTLLAIFDIPPDPDQYSIWHSTQTATNFSKYQSPRIDKLLEDGRNKIDQAERRQIYLDFQRFLVEDSPAAFLYHPVTYTVQRK